MAQDKCVQFYELDMRKPYKVKHFQTVKKKKVCFEKLFLSGCKNTTYVLDFTSDLKSKFSNTEFSSLKSKINENNDGFYFIYWKSRKNLTVDYTLKQFEKDEYKSIQSLHEKWNYVNKYEFGDAPTGVGERCIKPNIKGTNEEFYTLFKETVRILYDNFVSYGLEDDFLEKAVKEVLEENAIGENPKNEAINFGNREIEEIYELVIKNNLTIIYNVIKRYGCNIEIVETQIKNFMENERKIKENNKIKKEGETSKPE